MKAIVFGSGKIARGFIGHLSYLSGGFTVFVDVNESLILKLNERQSYNVHIMGRPEKDCVVNRFTALVLADTPTIAEQWLDADIAFTSVGGKNLPSLAKAIAHAFRIRAKLAPFYRPFNIITCENWTEPAALLGEEIKTNLSDDEITLFDRWIGISEAVVMRSAVEPTLEMLEADPLCVCVQDYWDLPVDRDRIKGELVPIDGVRYIEQFAGFLERKFYTYNAANGTVAYLGYLKQHKYIYEAAMDPQIITILDLVYQETAQALAKKHAISLTDQLAFCATSKSKLRDSNIIDYIERNARDPIRKLGPNDRLIGSARLVMRYGIEPHALATSIAAAIHYDHPDDPIAKELRNMREQYGMDYILEHVCQLSSHDSLSILVKSKIENLKSEGWIQ